MIVTAHLREGLGAEDTRLIADRWRPWAFLAPLLWSLWTGHWVLAIIVTLLLAGLFDLTLTQPELAFAAGLALRLIMGWEAGAFARLDRRLRGWRERGAVEARSMDEAELRWFGTGA